MTIFLIFVDINYSFNGIQPKKPIKKEKKEKFSVEGKARLAKGGGRPLYTIQSDGGYLSWSPREPIITIMLKVARCRSLKIGQEL